MAVLADWDWDKRPATVVALGSADPARAEMVASTAEALARVGQMSYGGAVRAGETEVQARNSAFRVNALDRYFDYSGLDVGEGPVLLLAGEVDSGWSVTPLPQPISPSDSVWRCYRWRSPRARDVLAAAVCATAEPSRMSKPRGMRLSLIHI